MPAPTDCKLGVESLAAANAANAANDGEEIRTIRSIRSPLGPEHDAVEARQAWAEALLERFHSAVARETPAGLGAWEPAWERVNEPSQALLDAVAEYERTGAAEAKQAVIRLAGEVLNAWRCVGEEWVRAGKPGGRNE